MLWNNRVSAALELTAVQSGKLGLELLVFQFELADAAVLFLELFIGNSLACFSSFLTRFLTLVG